MNHALKPKFCEGPKFIEGRKCRSRVSKHGDDFCISCFSILIADKEPEPYIEPVYDTFKPLNSF